MATGSAPAPSTRVTVEWCRPSWRAIVPTRHFSAWYRRAILYSLIETAKLRGLDPADYLRKAARAAIRQPGAVVLPD